MLSAGTRCKHDRANERGFVLVYVLAVIAVLSLLTVIAASNLQRQQALLRDIADRNVLSERLTQAEAIVQFSFLHSPIVSGGLDLSGRAVDEVELALGEPLDESELTADLVWSVYDGRRSLVFPDAIVIIVYQDADGLVSLNAADPSVLSAWFETYTNLEMDKSEFAAKLGDYVDADNSRSFQGAERADYRLAGLRSPQNSPIRSFRELQQIYGMQDFQLSRLAFPFRVTFFSTSSQPREAGMPDDLNDALQRTLLGSQVDRDDLAANQLINSRFPSERAQFILSAYSPDSELILRRVVEIERTTASPDHPYKMRRLMETATRRSQADTEQFSVNDDILVELPDTPVLRSQ